MAKPSVLRNLARRLGCEVQERKPTLAGIWSAAITHARSVFQGRPGAIDGWEYHPLLWSVWRGEEDETTLALRHIVGFPEARQRLEDLGIPAPDPTAPAWEIMSCFEQLCDMAAGVGIDISRELSQAATA